MSIISFSFSNSINENSIIIIPYLPNQHLFEGDKFLNIKEINIQLEKNNIFLEYPIIEFDVFTFGKLFKLTVELNEYSIVEFNRYRISNPIIIGMTHYFGNDFKVSSIENHLDMEKLLEKYYETVSSAFQVKLMDTINIVGNYLDHKITFHNLYESLRYKIEDISFIELNFIEIVIGEFYSANNLSLGKLFREIAFKELFSSEFPNLKLMINSLIYSITIENKTNNRILQIINTLNVFNFTSKLYSIKYNPNFLKYGFQLLMKLCIEIDKTDIGIISSLLENYVNDLKPTILEMDLIYDRFKIEALSKLQKFKLQKLKENFVRKVPLVEFESSDQIYNYFIEKNNFTANNSEPIVSKMIKLENWLKIYNYYCFYTRINPDYLIHDFVLSNTIKYQIDRLSDTEIFGDWTQNEPLKINFNHTVKIMTNIFANSNPNEVLLDQLQYINENSFGSFYQNLWYNRLSLYIADNFYNIKESTIKEFLQITLPQKVNYITPNVLILQLLRCLVEEKTLSSEELYFLQNYLHLEIEEYSKDTIAELIYSINQLERSPKMLIQQEDGTILQYEEQTISEGSKITLQTPEILSISEEIVDIIPAEDLMDYLYLFFQYHNLTRFSQKMSDEKKYNELTNLKAYTYKFEKYVNQFTKLRHANKWSVDDIQINFAIIETLIEESPEYALSKLTYLRPELENRDVPASDWMRFNQLQSDLNKRLGIEQTV